MESLNGREKPKYEKIESLKLMESIGLPVLAYEILDEKNFKEQIKDFLAKHSLNKFLIRTDGQGTSTPSLLDVSADEETFQKIEQYFLNGFLVFVGHPGNIYRDLHSVNIEISGDNSNIEVAGPGFNARDLSRHPFAHHESLTINLDSLSVSSRWIGAEQYQRDRISALEQSDKQKLEDNRSYLLDNAPYRPMNSYEIEFLKDASLKLDGWRRQFRKGPFIASMSFIDVGNENAEDIQPYFWDIHEEIPKTEAPHPGD